MPKLLQVTTVPLALEAFLLPFAKHFRSKGWQVDAMASGVSESVACRAAFDQVWEAAWGRSPAVAVRSARGALRQVRAVVEAEGYDLVHVHTPIAAFLARLALRVLRRRGQVRVVYTAHGFYFHERGRAAANLLFRFLEKLAGRWTDYLVVINREDEAAAQRDRFVPPERLRYVPGIGIDRVQYSPAQVTPAQVAAVRAELGLNQGDVLFVMVAEYNPGKRHADALQALARLRRPNVHLALAGAGPMEPALRRLAATLGLAGRLHFLGWRADVPVLLRAARASVLPSEREGLPRSVMESLCLETPVIGADIRGLRELVTPACGFLVEVGDVAGLADALHFLADHPEEAATMGRAGRRLMKPFDLQNVLAHYEAIYEEALRAAPITP